MYTKNLLYTKILQSTELILKLNILKNCGKNTQDESVKFLMS